MSSWRLRRRSSTVDAVRIEPVHGLSDQDARLLHRRKLYVDEAWVIYCPKSVAAGHGRNGAAAYHGARKIPVPHAVLKAGDPCPERCGGKVYPQRDPGVLFEIGTFDGRTTLNLAAHSRDEARVYTLDLPRAGMDAAGLPLALHDRKYVDKAESGVRFHGADGRAAELRRRGGQKYWTGFWESSSRWKAHKRGRRALENR